MEVLIMVTAAPDHMVAIVIIGIIFVGTVVVLPATSFSNLNVVDQQQLRNTAYNVFDAMLLDVGSPSKWGSSFPFDQSTVEKFGLAYSDPFSKFVLDVDKVQRLDASNPTGFVEYERVRELLNLNEYGFHISMLRPFSVGWSLNVTSNEVDFYVAVTKTEDGTPIPNAEVKVTTTVATNDGKEFSVVRMDPVTYFTDVRGVCEGVQYPSVSGTINHAISVMTITVAGLSTTVVAQSENPFAELIKLNTSGDTIILSLPDEVIGDNTHSERRVHRIDAYVSEEMLTLFDKGTMLPPEIKFTSGSEYEYWSLEYPGLGFMDPTALIFWIELTLKSYGRVIIVLAGSLDFMAEQEILGFGPDPQYLSVTPIVTMRRLVVISEMTYVCQLAFWRE
jgi:type II secretory pathway pseudopilin PulG